MGLATEFRELIRDRVGLKCDEIDFKGLTIYFKFHTKESWDSDFNQTGGLERARDPIARAFMLGFTEYVFVRHDGVEFPTSKNFWIARPGRRRSFRRRGYEF